MLDDGIMCQNCPWTSKLSSKPQFWWDAFWITQFTQKVTVNGFTVWLEVATAWVPHHKCGQNHHWNSPDASKLFLDFSHAVGCVCLSVHVSVFFFLSMSLQIWKKSLLKQDTFHIENAITFIWISPHSACLVDLIHRPILAEFSLSGSQWQLVSSLMHIADDVKRLARKRGQTRLMADPFTENFVRPRVILHRKLNHPSVVNLVDWRWVYHDDGFCSLKAVKCALCTFDLQWYLIVSVCALGVEGGGFPFLSWLIGSRCPFLVPRRGMSSRVLLLDFHLWNGQEIIFWQYSLLFTNRRIFLSALIIFSPLLVLDTE